MQNSDEWLTMGRLGKVSYRINVNGQNRQGVLRFTVYQQEQYKALSESDGKDKNIYDLCEIALNPEPNKIEFTLDDIKKALDIDEARILFQTWLEKKVLKPTLSHELDKSFF